MLINPLEGKPGRPKPFVQSTCDTREDVVAFGDQIKLRLDAPSTVGSAAMNDAIDGYDESPFNVVETE